MLQYPNPSVSGAHLEFRQRSLVHQSHGLWPSEKWPVIRQKPLAGKCLPAPFHTSCSINLSIAAGGVQKNTHFLHVICGLKVCCNIYYQKDSSLDSNLLWFSRNCVSKWLNSNCGEDVKKSLDRLFFFFFMSFKKKHAPWWDQLQCKAFK